MFPQKKLYLAVAGCLAFSTAVAAEPSVRLSPEEVETANVMLVSPVVVTATRIEQNSFDLPVSIDVVSGDILRDNQQRVNLSETAIRVPGIVIGDRNNASQDQSVSSRGFGARSQFGVRGVRLYADGIPMSMPDGQGQTGTFNLDTAKSVEFLRGPFSALYGNSSGGVVQIFTKDGGPETVLDMGVTFGSYETQRQYMTLSGKEGSVDYVINASHYTTDGFRAWGDSTRNMVHAKVGFQFTPDTRLTIVTTALDQPESKDPRGLTKKQLAENPSQVGGSSASPTIANNMHKDIQHAQAGAILEHKVTADDVVKVTGYYGRRENIQYLPSSASAIDRNFGGFDVRWAHSGQFISRPVNFTVGTNFERMEDKRKRYAAAGGIITGAATRSELNEAYNFDQYVQAEWDIHDQLSLHGGLRHTRVVFENTDELGGAANGSATYTDTMPVAGVVFKVTPWLNFYANAGDGFETPTFAEQTYIDTIGNGPNPNLKPSKSKNLEIGTKAFLADNTLLNLALFRVRSEKEIVVDASGDTTVYKNAGDTERKGVELSLDSNFGHGLKGYLAYTLMDAEFKAGNGANTGNKIPGTYRSRLYAEVSWTHQASGFSTALEGQRVSKTYVNDANTAAAEDYSVFSWRGGFTQKLNAWKFGEFVRIDNLFDQNYVGSIKPNDSAGRFYEPAAPRNWTLGINASYQF